MKFEKEGDCAFFLLFWLFSFTLLLLEQEKAGYRAFSKLKPLEILHLELYVEEKSTK
jgi:hypothetical protein